MGITFGKLGVISKYKILCPYCSSTDIIEDKNCQVYFNITTGESEIKSCTTTRFFCGSCGHVIQAHYILERGW